ncbi:TonB-dependent receptor plug domain-containing protein [Fulvivirga kasyanovii]|uniref:TonB-dependent receptor n=1 Tax=Fulvivirga kasyanovii TaxID=396812 RepID=A0ABW9RT69_9BACT|nr:TonB-dependent receptor [Fulvivirga kasyanovii]MTI26494.1 TonB-dependent receptor [Fulvivirga kasyanovii]
MKNTFLGCLCFLLSLCTMRGHAQSDTTTAAFSRELEEIVISASRVKAKEEDLPQQVQVITDTEIQQSGSKDVVDVLKKKAGVDVIQYPGLLSGIGIRGYRPQFSGLNQRSLLLIDGRPAGATNLATIDLDNIESIEVIKGAASSLYGSQAMGGVVNIVTKKSVGEIKKSLYASFGSYNTFELGLNVGGNLSEQLDFDVNLKHLQQDKDYRHGHDNLFRDKFGWDEATRTYYSTDYEIDSTTVANDVYGDGEEREYATYQYQSGGIRFGYQFHRNWRASVSGTFFSASNVQTPGDYFYGNTSQSLKNPYRYGADLKVEGKINSNHQVSLRAYNSLEYSDFRSVSAGVVSDYVTSKRTNKWVGFQLQDSYNIGKHILTYGFDYNRSNTTSESFNSKDGSEKAPYSPNYGIYSTALFAQAHLKLLDDKLFATLGTRVDNITFDVKETRFLDTYKAAEESHQVFNPSLGLKYKLPNNFDIHASAGRAFVTPDAYNVAGYSISGPGKEANVKGKVNISYGNPDLEPEKGITIDGGVGYLNKKNGLNADVTYFSTRVKDRITQGPTVIPNTIEITHEGDTIASTTTYINAEAATMSGLETSISWDLGALDGYEYSFKIFINAVKYIKLEEEFRNTAYTQENKISTKKVQNVADLTLTYGLEYTNYKFDARLAARYVGPRYDTDWTDYINRPEIEYPAFMLLDFSIGFPVNENGRLMILANNITDENYYEKRGFNMPGRNMQVKYTHNF